MYDVVKVDVFGRHSIRLFNEQISALEFAEDQALHCYDNTIQFFSVLSNNTEISRFYPETKK